MFEWFRHAVGVRSELDGQKYGENGFANGLLCFWCSSVWFSTAISVLLALFGWIAPNAILLYVPAVSAGAILIDEVIGWLEHRP